MIVPFDTLPNDARIWIYPAHRSFSEAEQAEVQDALTQFLSQWTAHSQDLEAGFELRYNRFIVIGVNQYSAQASGCSIDSSVRVIREIEVKLNINLLDSGKVAYLEGDNVRVAFLPEIKNHVVEGSLKSNSRMFNPSVNKIADLKDNWLIEADRSWLKKYFAN